MTAAAADRQPRARRLMVPLAEAADVLGVPEDTLRWAGDAGDIPLRRIGTRRLLPAAWLESVTAWDPRPGEVT